MKKDTAITPPCNQEVNPSPDDAGAKPSHCLYCYFDVMCEGMRLFLIKGIVI